MQSSSPSPSSSDPKLPNELLDQLHGANERLHSGRQRLEKALESTEDGHQERVHAVSAELRQAQREWDEVDRKIHEAMGAEVAPREHGAD